MSSIVPWESAGHVGLESLGHVLRMDMQGEHWSETNVSSSLRVTPLGTAITLGSAINWLEGSPLPTPTGKVTYYEGGRLVGYVWQGGGTQLGEVTIVDGVVPSLPGVMLSLGGHNITAKYSGDDYWAPSESPPMMVLCGPDLSGRTPWGQKYSDGGWKEFIVTFLVGPNGMDGPWTYQGDYRVLAPYFDVCNGQGSVVAFPPALILTPGSGTGVPATLAIGSDGRVNVPGYDGAITLPADAYYHASSPYIQIVASTDGPYFVFL